MECTLGCALKISGTDKWTWVINLYFEMRSGAKYSFCGISFMSISHFEWIFNTCGYRRTFTEDWKSEEPETLNRRRVVRFSVRLKTGWVKSKGDGHKSAIKCQSGRISDGILKIISTTQTFETEYPLKMKVAGQEGLSKPVVFWNWIFQQFRLVLPQLKFNHCEFNLMSVNLI